MYIRSMAAKNKVLKFALVCLLCLAAATAIGLIIDHYR